MCRAKKKICISQFLMNWSWFQVLINSFPFKPGQRHAFTWLIINQVWRTWQVNFFLLCTSCHRPQHTVQDFYINHQSLGSFLKIIHHVIVSVLCQFQYHARWSSGLRSEISSGSAAGRRGVRFSPSWGLYHRHRTYNAGQCKRFDKRSWMCHKLNLSCEVRKTGTYSFKLPV